MLSVSDNHHHHTEEIEAAALGALLIDGGDLAGLRETDFCARRHRLIFAALASQAAQQGAVDIVAVADELARAGTLAEVGGMVALAGLLESAPPAASLPRYAAFLRDAGVRRALREKTAQIGKIATEADTAAEAIDLAEAEIAALRHQGGGGMATMTDAMRDYFRGLEARQRAGGGITGATTGFPGLDALTCGLQPGELTLIAARPSMGKTSLALGFAESAAKSGVSTAIYSLEMSRDQLMQRMISARARIDSQRLRSGRLADADWERLTRAADELHRLPIVIDDSCSPTVMDIRARARQVARERGLGLIVVDYVGLIRPVKQHSVREREIAEISRGLKALAKELAVPVVVACQLNRALEAGAQPRKPMMSDLRESGALEQDADLVLFPWRESALCHGCKEAGCDCGKGHYRAGEIIVGKQRNGPTGTVKAVWLPEFSQFAPAAREE